MPPTSAKASQGRVGWKARALTWNGEREEDEWGRRRWGGVFFCVASAPGQRYASLSQEEDSHTRTLLAVARRAAGWRASAMRRACFFFSLDEKKNCVARCSFHFSFSTRRVSRARDNTMPPPPTIRAPPGLAIADKVCVCVVGVCVRVREAARVNQKRLDGTDRSVFWCLHFFSPHLFIRLSTGHPRRPGHCGRWVSGGRECAG